MIELLAVLLPIVVTDALNPVLVAAVIFALGTPHPYRGALWVLTGWFVVYFTAGVVLSTGLERVTGAASGPQPIDFALQVPIALGLVWLAYAAARSGENPRAPRRVPRPTSSTHMLGSLSGVLLGATISLVGLPFALPYFAAIDQTLKADLGFAEAVRVLAIYNLAYLLPFAALALLRFVYRDRADALFTRVNVWVERSGAVVMPLMLFAVGATLTLDAVLYFTTDAPLIDIAPAR